MLDQIFTTTLFDLRNSAIQKINKLESARDFDSKTSSARHNEELRGETRRLETINNVISAYFATQKR